MNENSQCLLLGQDYTEYGQISHCAIDINMACSISVGSDKNSPSLANKASKQFPNEDAVLIKRQGNNVVLAVADAHFGHWASHALLLGLDEYKGNLSNRSSIFAALNALPAQFADPEQRSATTLIIVSVNTATGNGFGISFGDSTAALVNESEVIRINQKSTQFVNLNNPEIFSPSYADEFQFRMQANEMLLLFTDGVDECHYCQPLTSVNDTHILELFQEQSENINQYVIELAGLALAGVDGNPGGQDNVAIAAYQYGR